MICLDAFKNVNVAKIDNELKISPCCISPLRKIEKLDFQNDPYLSAIRQEWAQGHWPKECENCKSIESQGQESRRINSNKWYKDNGVDNDSVELIRLDYWVGDTCNLACVMCGPENSSLWKQELKIPLAQRFSSANDFWLDLDLEKLRFIHFHGGEPLLSKEHVKFLKAIPHKSRVQIYYNTNATIRAAQDLLDLWSKFELVQIDFSIDDIDARFDYIRYPARWHEVEDTLFWYRENSPNNCIFNLMTVVSVLNQPYLDQLDSWTKNNFATNRFTDIVEHRYQPCYGVLSTENVGTRKESIIEHLDKISARRGLDWKKIFPKTQDFLNFS